MILDGMLYVIDVCSVTNVVTIGQWCWDCDRWRWIGSMTCRDFYESIPGIKSFSCQEEAELTCAIYGIELTNKKDAHFLIDNRLKNI